ncbi:hypothetical protein NA57DRAFT_75661 [Rhizodiscina lignyota]|uniref:Uncharacterized protein n=1 Tax=Rhizodiscina lignyota TaxID=1504668 RepID=A0A9P4IEL9_9PEZI|nr:hypothetical protein NA57DRAFT_75661 [Rhizodiscina lignyota]
MVSINLKELCLIHLPAFVVMFLYVFVLTGCQTGALSSLDMFRAVDSANPPNAELRIGYFGICSIRHLDNVKKCSSPRNVFKVTPLEEQNPVDSNAALAETFDHKVTSRYIFVVAFVIFGLTALVTIPSREMMVWPTAVFP